MGSKKLSIALAKSKDVAINLLGSVLSRTRVEPIRDAAGLKGVKARWVGDHGENVVKINTPSGSADIQMEGGNAPSVEYVQHGESRTVAVRNIKNFSCELDRELLDRIATPKGAGIAVCIGAAVGLSGWFLISIMRSLSLSSTADGDNSVPSIAADEVRTQDENPSL